MKGGLPWQRARADGGWEPDPWTWDDQGVMCHVKGRGLVVVSSCSHAGVINVLRNAARVTGVPKVHGFVSGLHLIGGLFEPIIPWTVEALAGIAPDVVVPGHCTGWRATHAIARRLPGAYVQTSVGTTVRFSFLIQDTVQAKLRFSLLAHESRGSQTTKFLVKPRRRTVELIVIRLGKESIVK